MRSMVKPGLNDNKPEGGGFFPPPSSKNKTAASERRGAEYKDENLFKSDQECL